MKVLFKNMVNGYSGKCDGLVYYYNSRLGRTLVRKNVKPKPTEQHNKFRTVSQNLINLDVSEGYKQDLTRYAFSYSRAKIKGKLGMNNWFSLLIKIMWTMAKKFDIDIAKLTRDDIKNKDLPCRTVKQAVEAELIPQVPGYELLINEF